MRPTMCWPKGEGPALRFDEGARESRCGLVESARLQDPSSGRIIEVRGILRMIANGRYRLGKWRMPTLDETPNVITRARPVLFLVDSDPETRAEIDEALRK